MNGQLWNQVKAKYQLGRLIYGKVEFHAPFGVFVDIGDLDVKGMIQITDFLDSGSMHPDMYPEIGSAVGAIVVGYGYTQDDRNQVWLSVKPSVLKKSLIKLRAHVANQVWSLMMMILSPLLGRLIKSRENEVKLL
jgi:hypothetical protein